VFVVEEVEVEDMTFV